VALRETIVIITRWANECDAYQMDQQSGVGVEDQQKGGKETASLRLKGIHCHTVAGAAAATWKVQVRNSWRAGASYTDAKHVKS